MNNYKDLIILAFVGFLGMMALTFMMFYEAIFALLLKLGMVVLVLGGVLVAFIGVFGAAYLINWMLNKSSERYARKITQEYQLQQFDFDAQERKLQLESELLKLEAQRIENHNKMIAGSIIIARHDQQVMGVNGAPPVSWRIEPTFKPPKPLPAPVIEEVAPLQLTAKPVEDIRTGRAWVDEFLFDEYEKLKAYHLKIDGPTGAGKTWFTLYLMWLLQQPYPAAEYWLSDPKFEGEESGWPFDPFVQDFDDTAFGAQYMYDNIVTSRKHAKREGNPAKHPAFMIFDEADGCFDEHGEKFSKPVRRIVKEGRSGHAHAIIVGQSALVKDVGFSGALLRNTGRFVMGSEALSFIRNPQFNHWDNSLRDQWKAQLVHLQQTGKRYALAIPPSGQGLPFVGEIPHLELPKFNQARPPLTVVDGMVVDTNKASTLSKLSEEEKEIVALAAQGQSVSSISNTIYGYANARKRTEITNVLESLNLA